MSELRWALLVVGVLFVAGLVVWERRKRRHREGERLVASGGGFPASHERGAGPVGISAGSRGSRGTAYEDGGREEPTFSMPGLPRRDPVRDLPVVEIDPRSGAGPGVGDLPVFDMGQANRSGGGFGAGTQDSPRVAVAAADDAARYGGSGEVGELSEPGVVTQTDPVERASAWLADSIPEELPQTTVLDWPPEDQRRIVALRVVPRPGERFNGAALRQALVGEGFIHGELEIYHKPIGDSRVLLSAASLTRPGTFDPKTIDGLLFAGLNVFAVMPGPLPARETIERLCLVGRTLAQRLRGEAQDSKGLPLTEARVAELRREATDGAS